MSSAAVKRQLKVILGSGILGVQVKQKGEVSRNNLITLLAQNQQIVSALTDLYGKVAESCPNDINAYSAKDPCLGDLWYVAHNWKSAGDSQKGAIINFLEVLFHSKPWKLLSLSRRKNEINIRQKFSMQVPTTFHEEKPNRGGESYIGQPIPSDTGIRHQTEKTGDAVKANNLSNEQAKGMLQPPAHPDALMENQGLPIPVSIQDAMTDISSAEPDNRLNTNTQNSGLGVQHDQKLMKNQPTQGTSGYKMPTGHVHFGVVQSSKKAEEPMSVLKSTMKQSKEDMMVEAKDSQESTSSGQVTAAGQQQLNITNYTTNRVGTGSKATPGSVANVQPASAPRNNATTLTQGKPTTIIKSHGNVVNPYEERRTHTFHKLYDSKHTGEIDHTHIRFGKEDKDTKDITRGVTPTDSELDRLLADDRSPTPEVKTRGRSKSVDVGPPISVGAQKRGRGRTPEQRKRRKTSATFLSPVPAAPGGSPFFVPSTTRSGTTFSAPSAPIAISSSSTTASSSDPATTTTTSLVEQESTASSTSGKKMPQDTLEEEESNQSKTKKETTQKKGKKMNLMGRKSAEDIRIKERNEKITAKALEIEKLKKELKHEENTGYRKSVMDDLSNRIEKAENEKAHMKSWAEMEDRNTKAQDDRTRKADTQSLVETGAETEADVENPYAIVGAIFSTLALDKPLRETTFKTLKKIWNIAGDTLDVVEEALNRGEQIPKEAYETVVRWFTHSGKSRKAQVKGLIKEKYPKAFTQSSINEQKTDPAAFSALVESKAKSKAKIFPEEGDTKAWSAYELTDDDLMDLRYAHPLKKNKLFKDIINMLSNERGRNYFNYGLAGVQKDYIIHALKEMNSKEELEEFFNITIRDVFSEERISEFESREEKKGVPPPEKKGAPDDMDIDEDKGDEKKEIKKSFDLKQPTTVGFPITSTNPLDYKENKPNPLGGNRNIEKAGNPTLPVNRSDPTKSRYEDLLTPVKAPEANPELQRQRQDRIDLGQGEEKGYFEQKYGNDPHAGTSRIYTPTLRLNFREGDANIILRTNENPTAQRINRLGWQGFNNYSWEPNDEEDNPLHLLNIIDETRRFYAPLDKDELLPAQSDAAIQESYDSVKECYHIPEQTLLDGDTIIHDVRGGGNLSILSPDETDAVFHNVYLEPWISIPEDSPWKQFTQVEGSQLPDSMIADSSRYASNDNLLLRFQNSFITATES